MKEITITTTTTVKIPTANEIKATARIPSPIEPERALVVHCFVDGYEFSEAASHAVYECMAEADESLKTLLRAMLWRRIVTKMESSGQVYALLALQNTTSIL